MLAVATVTFPESMNGFPPTRRVCFRDWRGRQGLDDLPCLDPVGHGAERGQVVEGRERVPVSGQVVRGVAECRVAAHREEPGPLLLGPDGLAVRVAGHRRRGSPTSGGLVGKGLGHQVFLGDVEPAEPPLGELADAGCRIADSVPVPADPGQVFAFAAARGRAFLWRRAAVGQLFESVPLASFPSVAIPPGPASQLDDILDVGQASYDWFVAAPPEAPDVVYLGSKELVRGRRDGGEWHWGDVSSRPSGGDSIHPDQHVLAFDVRVPGVIYAGNDGGVFRSPDAGDSWQPLNAGLAISEVEYIAQRPGDPDWILAGLQDNGTVRTQTDSGRWEQAAEGNGGDCAVNAENPDVCYHTNYYISLSRSDRGGDPDPPPPARPFWQRVTPPNTGLDRFQQLFYPPLEVKAMWLPSAARSSASLPTLGSHGPRSRCHRSVAADRIRSRRPGQGPHIRRYGTRRHFRDRPRAVGVASLPC
jgi:hypothetical protein